ncbi:acyltransferase [Flavobacterium aquidurense]|uniref:acyltransferase family protein n=1 Tax=Flavobacterium aquidurense TaxID=362413 RepID=UPI00285BD10F|nr:acyltransferase [Flavobacterium aquidurense]MDR7372355.1 peptidoglycan/LPS O-acetylase OafA/YrhL [Flavobacterium aquidurense]
MVDKNYRFGYVDTMRGIAIFLVVLVHTSQFYLLGNELSIFAKYGQLGVQLFFVASAYTLCFSMPFYDRKAFNLKHFYIKRYFRIAPLYYIGIGIYFFISYVLYIIKGINNFEYYNVKGFLSNIFLVHSFFPKYNNSIVPGGWSIATEVLFYLIFPFLFYFIKNYSVKKTVYIIIIYTLLHLLVLSCAKEFFNFGKIENNSFYYYSIINQFPVFLFGMVMFKIIKNENIKLVTFFILPLLCTLIILLLWYYNPFFAFVLIPVFAGVVFLSLGVLLSVVNMRFKLIENFGKLSYSIYIYHFIFSWYLIVLIDGKISFLRINIYILYMMYLLISLGFSFLIGFFSEKYIEQYFVKFGKEIINNSIKNKIGR